jgi:condensin complex subunit 3
VPLTPATVPAIFTRTRDIDPAIRKSLLSSILPKLDHPKQLSIAQREQVIRDAIADQEPSVRVAGGKLIEAWFELTVDEVGEGDEGIMDGLVSFLTLFDVIGGEAIAIDALYSLFTTRPDILEHIAFSGKFHKNIPASYTTEESSALDEFWNELTPESTLLCRVFIEHCNKCGRNMFLEAASLPVLTSLALYMQETYKTVRDLLQEECAISEVVEEAEAWQQMDDDLVQQTFILGELFKIAVKLDYGDQIGRRKVFTVIRESDAALLRRIC